ncbi:MAG: ribosome biogenesis GTPase Der [Planctomycetota bacterium]|jgi:GTP-binding protein
MDPVVTIVGRPNVGKSSLLNSLLGRRYAIVDDMAGVTRDRVSATCRLEGRRVELVDTGGIGIVDKQALEAHVEAQIEQALAMSDAVIFVCDARDGCTAMDKEIAAALRRLDVPVTLAVNKAESREALSSVSEFAQLGWDPMPISAMERTGLGYLADLVVEGLPAGEVLADDEPDEAPAVRIAIVGRVNVGKSTFLNHLAGTERAIVSEVPGTTRDAVDLLIEKDGLKVLITDTAGIKRESAVQDSVEFYAQRRAEHSISRSDVTLLLLDCTDDLTRGDRKIASFIEDAVKPVVIVANKWDLAKGNMDISEYADYLAKKLPGLHYAPIVFTTAAEGKNVLAAIDTAQALFRQASLRVGTPAINKVLESARTDFRPPVRLKGTPKIFYGTQIDVKPPTLMLFVNDPRIFISGYRRFLENRLREALPFKEIPLRVIYKRRRSIFGKDAVR